MIIEIKLGMHVGLTWKNLQSPCKLGHFNSAVIKDLTSALSGIIKVTTQINQFQLQHCILPSKARNI